MQNVAQGTAADNPKIDKVNSQVVQQQHQQQQRQQQQQRDNLLSTPVVKHQSSSSAQSSPTETYSEHRQYMSDTSESEEDSVSEVESFVIDQEYEVDPQVAADKFILSQENRTVDPETQARLEALLQAAGISQLATKDGKHLADPEVLRRLTSSVSSALDEAAAALTRMRSDTSTHVQLAAAVVASKQHFVDQPPLPIIIEDLQEEQEEQQQTQEDTVLSPLPQPTPQTQPVVVEKTLSLVEACTDGDVCTVRKLLTEGRSVHETSEDGESLLSLACSAGYYELSQVLLAMHANVEDRGIKGECTPLMEAASAGHIDIVKLLVAHGADVNAQSTSGNTPLMYGCAGGHEEVVKFLLGNGANVEDHNENGHTPLMEAASAGHVGLAMILLENGAGINTHSNEFKESALTLACYKGHLEMVKFLLEAGADQEHKTDEMHTALMEASMDGHVEVARLLLDSGAQVNMPTDSFESPLTLAACGGHVDLAMLLIERGANIEEVNDEGYTPLMEAAREGHEDMVALLLSQGANINAQTDETQETALTLACCGGFTEVADFLIKAGADIELGASTPLMEAAQEGHLELVKYLLENSALVGAITQTGDTALTYACENGHTDVADLLLQFGADLEHESEGGRTPLMKACRAGHLCTVQFLISKGANVRRQTSNNDHTPLSLACAGGHLPVVELLLAHRADPNHKLKDNSTMLIEAAKGGHTNVVQLLLDYPHSMMLNHQPTVAVAAAAAAAAAASSTAATNLSMLPGQVGSRDSLSSINIFNPTPEFSPAVLQEVPEAVRIISQMDVHNATAAAAAAAAAASSAVVDATALSVAATGASVVAAEISSPVTAAGTSLSVAAAAISSSSVVAPPSSVAAAATLASAATSSVPSSSMLTLPTSSSVAAATLMSAAGSSAVSPSSVATTTSSTTSAAGSSSYANTSTTTTATTINIVATTTTNASISPNIICSSTITTATTTMPIGPRKCSRPSSAVSSTSTVGSAVSVTSSVMSSLSDTPVASISNLFETTDSDGNSVCGGGNLITAEELQAAMEFLVKHELSTYGENTRNIIAFMNNPTMTMAAVGDSCSQKKIFDDLNRVDREFHGNQQTHNNYLFQCGLTLPLDDPVTTVASSATATTTTLPPTPPLNIDIAGMQQKVGAFSGSNAFYTSTACLQQTPIKLSAPLETFATPISNIANQQQAFYFANTVTQPIKFQTSPPHAEVSQNTAISDRPKVKPVSKKEGKNLRKLYNPQQVFIPPPQQQLQQLQQVEKIQESLQGGFDLDNLDQEPFVLKEDDAASAANQESMLTASILQQFHSSPQQGALRAEFVPTQIPGCSDPNNGQQLLQQRKTDPEFDNAIKEATKLMERRAKYMREDLDEDVVQNLECYSINDVTDQQNSIQVNNPYGGSLDENMIATLAIQQDLKDLTGQTDVSRVEYFAVPNNGAQLPVQQSFETYEHLLQVGNRGYQAGFQAGISLMQRTLACPNATASTSTTEASAAPPPPPPPVTSSQAASPLCTHSLIQTTTHHCEVPCSQHSVSTSTDNPTNVATVQPQVSHQVQAATQTVADKKNKTTVIQENLKKKGGRLVFRHQPTSSGNIAPVINNNQQQPFQNNQNYQIDPNSAITQYGSTAANQYASAVATTAASAATTSVPPVNFCMDVDSETESNHDTALTLACAGGHEELVELLIARGSNIEHRDKKGFTPLILAATAGHEKVVEILIKNGAEIEAQSERTKDTPLSLACSGGRYEVVEILLNKSANKEHRNVSDYTPLSLAASGGYVNIIKLLLNHGAEINSRTGSKLGISPLMLAAMNGHTSAVKLLLDMGSDINAQIETNRNTALTLACFQGRHEVVSLLLDRKANVEHRAKTGLTPLMEAASGGYVEVGRVLLDKGAEVNATPVPSSRDTALTIAADKGHVRFVELLLCRGAAVEVKNKKGNSPLWLAANGGHLNVVELLYNLSADIDSQDNRKVSCLMAAFRKGHTKVVKWMVTHVSQFPSDQEMIRYISTVSDKELLEKCQECVKIIRAAKETQAAKANKNASILLEELDMEKNREESKKAAAARRRERKKKKKLEKKEEKRKLTEENKKNEDYDEKNDEDLEKTADDDDAVQENIASPIMNGAGESAADKEEGDSGIDANSQGSCSSNDVKSNQKRKDKKKKKGQAAAAQSTSRVSAGGSSSIQKAESKSEDKRNREATESSKTESNGKGSKVAQARKGLVFDSSTRSPAERDDFEATGDSFVSAKNIGNSKKEDLQTTSSKLNSSTSPKQAGKQREDGWKEVVRKSSVQTVATSSGSDSGVKKVSVPLNAISRVIGRGGSNINAIRGATGAHIEVEKQSKGQGERIITIKGTTEATKQAHSLIAVLIRDPDVDILQMLPKTNKVPSSVSTSLWDKTQIGTKKVAGKVMTSQAAVSTTVTTSCITVVTTASQQKTILLAPVSAAPMRFKTTTITSRATPTAAAASSAPTPRLAARGSVPQPEKSAAPSSSSVYQRNMITAAATNSSTTTTTTTTRSTGVKTSSQTFAAKLTEINQNSQLLVSVASGGSSSSKPRMIPQQQQTSPQSQQSNQSSPKHHHSRPTPTSSAPPNMQHYPTSNKPFSASVLPTSNDLVISQPCSPTPLLQSSSVHSHDPETIQTTTVTTTQVYSLFNTLTQQPIWKHEAQKPANFATVTGGSSQSSIAQNKFVDDDPPQQVDASKAPGYRGTAVCSPVSSKTSSNSTTPPNLPNFFGDSKGPLPPIGSNLSHNRPQANNSSNDVPHYFPSNNHLSDSSHFKSNYSESAQILTDPTPLLQAFQGNSMQQHISFTQQQPPVSISRLNPKAPDFSSSMHMGKNQMYNGYQNSYPPPIAKPMMNYHRRELPPHTPTNNSNWAMLQMPFNPQHNELMTGMAGMTLQNIVRATEALIENGPGDMGSNSPTMSPNLPPAHPLLMNESHYLEDRNKPQPIGTERARKSYNPSGSGNASTPTNDASSWMNSNWSRPNMEPYLARNSSLYNEDIHIIDSTLQHGIPPMEPSFNMNMSRQFYYPQSQQQQQQQQPPQQQMPAGASPAGGSGMSQHDFPSDLKSDMATWEARQNMAELQDKQRRWSNMNNRWNP